jgi:hypothetical protein
VAFASSSACTSNSAVAPDANRCFTVLQEPRSPRAVRAGEPRAVGRRSKNWEGQAIQGSLLAGRYEFSGPRLASIPISHVFASRLPATRSRCVLGVSFGSAGSSIVPGTRARGQVRSRHAFRAHSSREREAVQQTASPNSQLHRTRTAALLCSESPASSRAVRAGELQGRWADHGMATAFQGVLDSSCAVQLSVVVCA